MGAKVKKVFGIDLGTTYSSIAYVDDYGKPFVIPNAENERTTPFSRVFDGDTIIVGAVMEVAKLQPDDVISFVKRAMGEEHFTFIYNDNAYRPEEISSFVLRKLVKDAEQYLGENITDVVITCPAYFGITEREATKRAGEIAGLNVLEIINEPTAAAISYGQDEEQQNKVILIYDLGGGTFDVTMIEIRPDSVEVICTGGDRNLGGKDWDDRIIAHLVEEFRNTTGVEDDILEDPDTWQDLQISAERAKKILSQRVKTPVGVTYEGQRIKVNLTRETFESLTQDLLERSITHTSQMLNEAKKKGYEKFDDIILVGGSTRMPQISERLNREFGFEPKIFDPEEAVAKGAAIYAWKLSVSDEIKHRVAEHTKEKVEEVSVETDVDKETLDKITREYANDTGMTIPAVKSSMQRITNVASKSFGIIARNPLGEKGVFNLILKNTSVPNELSKIFKTEQANQHSVLVTIMESDSDDQWVPSDKANEIGEAVLVLPSGLPAQTPVEIAFSLNKEGRLLIKTKEKVQGKAVEAVINTRNVISGRDLAEAKNRSHRFMVE